MPPATSASRSGSRAANVSAAPAAASATAAAAPMPRLAPVTCTCLPASSAMVERRVGAFLQFVEGEAGDHVRDDKALRGHVDDREVGIDALDAGGGSERIGAAAQETLLALAGVVLHDDPDAAGAGGQIHRAADR